MDKQALKARMMELEAQELAHAREQYAEFIASARLDRTEPHEIDEISQATMAGDLAEAFDQPVQEHSEKLAVLEEMEFGPCDSVREGAVVQLEDRWFVISISTARFDFDGKTFMGISTAAPIYEDLEGSKAGDTVTFRDQKLKVGAVL